jgi:hypothetical protein
MTGVGSSPFDDPAERLANRQRIRAGFGYRRNFNRRYELLYIWMRPVTPSTKGSRPTRTSSMFVWKRVF